MPVFRDGSAGWATTVVDLRDLGMRLIGKVSGPVLGSA